MLRAEGSHSCRQISEKLSAPQAMLSRIWKNCLNLTEKMRRFYEIGKKALYYNYKIKLIILFLFIFTSFSRNFAG